MRNLFKGLWRVVVYLFTWVWVFITDPIHLLIIIIMSVAIIGSLASITGKNLQVKAEKARAELEWSYKKDVLGKQVVIDSKPYTAVDAWYKDGHHWVRLSGPGGEFTWEWKPELEK